MDRYDINPSEGNILPNKLDLTDQNQINIEEAAGFLRAENIAIDALGTETRFSTQYLLNLHREALGDLYDFAGKLRNVDMSKDGFHFVTAYALPNALSDFETKYLTPINSDQLPEGISFLDFLAEMHAELLYIHPFREGNGRIVRLFTKLIFLTKMGETLHFDIINNGDNFERYKTAVQQAAAEEYDLMKKLFREIYS